MTRRLTAMIVIFASIAYLVLSFVDRARATDLIGLYTAIVVTLLLVGGVRRAR